MSKEGISTLTVKELKEMLEGVDENLPVVFGYDYGDRCHSTIAGTIRQGDVKTVRYSGYHQKHVVADDDEETSEGIEAFILE